MRVFFKSFYQVHHKILYQVPFYLYPYKLFFFIKDVQLANFADDNTINAARNSTEELIKVLGKEGKSAIDWFKMNDMIVNSDNFQAMIKSCDKKRKQI